jgi:hypothetical protein
MKFLKVFVAVFACSGFLFAQAEGKTETKAQAIAEQQNSEMKIHGKVVSIDTVTNTIIVKEKNAKDTLNVQSGATIISGNKVIKLGDLKKGANVNVTWEIINGKKITTKIDEKITGGSAKQNY